MSEYEELIEEVKEGVVKYNCPHFSLTLLNGSPLSLTEWLETKPSVGDLRMVISLMKNSKDVTERMSKITPVPFSDSPSISKPVNTAEEATKLGVITNRVRVLFNGEEILGASTKGDKPESPKEIADVLRELLRMCEAVDIPDKKIF